jgi:hypothetical protein
MARSTRLLAASSLLAICAATTALPQDRGLSYTLYGTPGLLDMPAAIAAPDGRISATSSYFDGHLRNNFTFQVTPRLMGTFRYAGVQGYTLPGLPAPRDSERFYFDRSFDLRYQLAEEGEFVDWMPAVAVGLQDFLGTGQYSGEYIVATKTFGDSLRVTAGLGWGRLGSNNPIGAPFGERPALDFGEGGTVSFDQFFQGDAALFAGVEYAINDQWTFKAEYSSDAYTRESELGLIEVNSPVNVGVVYRPTDGIQVQAAYLYGSELAISGTVFLNPGNAPFGAGLDPAPVPVQVRGSDARAALSWDRTSLSDATLTDRIRRGFATEGLLLDGIEIGDRSVRVRYTNTRFRSEAQAMGRANRILTQLLPGSVERIVLEPQQSGIPMSAATFQRSDIEALENTAGASQAIRDRVAIGDAGGRDGLTPVPREDRFSWGVRPYLTFVLFDGDNPVQPDAGIELSAEYLITPNLVLSGAMRYRVTDFEEYQGDAGPQILHPVRTDGDQYALDGQPGIERLTLAYYDRPGPNLYSRVTVGYLEPMFGGVSGEILWAPVDRNYAVGAEVNYAVQRDFDQLLGFQDYDIVTGHASLYYDFQNGFQGQVDVGRYLAGDWGATFALDREFENGWRVGGYFTLTDVPFEDYGEGSFDKGIRVSIPLDYFIGTPSRRTFNNTLASLTRDGGARLQVDGRLYEQVRDGHLGDLDDSWGRFWR